MKNTPLYNEIHAACVASARAMGENIKSMSWFARNSGTQKDLNTILKDNS